MSYRYRTRALLGPWRDNFIEAVQDAARAGQVLFDGDDPANFRWTVPGEIEESAEPGAAQRRRA